MIHKVNIALKIMNHEMTHLGIFSMYLTLEPSFYVV